VLGVVARRRAALESRLFDTAIPAVYRVAGRRQFRLYRELLERDMWTRDHLAEVQLQMLRSLIRHAVSTVPYYRTLFRRLGATPDDIRSLDDYAKIPLLTKTVIRENLKSLRSETVTKVLENSTGGSSGIPMRFYVTREFLDVGSAAWFRNYSWTGLPLGCRKFYLWGHPRETRGARQLKGRFEHWLHRRLFFDAFAMSRSAAMQWSREIRRYGAQFGYGYASALDAVAEFLDESDERIDGVRAVMSTAERLYPHQRERIGRVFGCPVFDQYGSREIWSIASECRAGRMHVNSDLHVVEHVRLDDEVPNLVITPLHNYGMPMLRYVNEDLAGAVAGPCPCGLPHPTMTPVHGRTSDNFKAPDGRVIHGEYLTHLLYGVDGVSRFQFVQRSLEVVELFVVKSPQFDRRTESSLRSIEDEFARYFGVPLTIRHVDELPPSPTGKLRFTVSHV
jgi:phenylacetate-CoA ligase